MSRPREILGAPASNAGDAFHEAWALRHALMLLERQTLLTHVTVEGVRDSAETDDKANWDGVDCALYYDEPSDASKSSVELVQLKYSVSAPKRNWTLARLCSSTGKDRNNSVIRRLADAFVAASKGKSFDEVRSSVFVKLVSNQPMQPQMLKQLQQASQAKLEGEAYDKLKTATGLGVKKLKLFCEQLTLAGGEQGRADLQEHNTKTIAQLLQSPVRDMVASLQIRIQERMGPEGSSGISRETVFGWFQLGDQKALFPCETRFEKLRSVLRRSVSAKLAEKIRENQLVIFHGEGGCGKTTTALTLKGYLPDGSKVIVYDCYGGGSYRDQSQPRHKPLEAFTQLSNELARETTTPLFFPYSTNSNIAASFRAKLEKAADALRLEHPDSLLVIHVDAADNALAFAKSRTPAEECFVDQLLTFTELAPNIKIVVSLRTSRLSLISTLTSTEQVRCPPFSIEETTAFLEMRGLVGTQGDIEEFHSLSNATPRVQANAVEEASTLHEAINFLRPNGKSLPDLFSARMHEAIVRSGANLEKDLLCSALTALPSPAPLKYVSELCGISEAVCKDILTDLAPNLRLGEHHVEFSNEDFEHYCEEDAKSQLGPVSTLLSKALERDRHSSEYAATHLFDALIAAGRKPELCKYLEEVDATAAIDDPIKRRRADLFRLKAALHTASLAGDDVAVAETVFIGAEAIRAAGKVEQVMFENLDLSAAHVADTIGPLILNDPKNRSNQGPFLFNIAATEARRRDLYNARLHLRYANAWMNEYFEQKEAKADWNSKNEDLTERAVTYFRVLGWPAVEKDCDRWQPKSYGIALRNWAIRKLCLEEGPNILEGIVSEICPNYRFLTVNALTRAGRTVPIEQILAALATLSKLNFSIFAGDRDYSYQRSIPSQLKEEVLFFLEQASLREEINASKILKALNSIWPQSLDLDSNVTVSHPYPIDFEFRSQILKARITGEQVSLETAFLEPEEPKAKDVSRTDRLQYERRRENFNEVSKLTKAYEAYAAIIQAPDEARVQTFLRELGALSGRDNRTWGYRPIRSLLRHRCMETLAASCSDQKLQKLVLETASTSENEFTDIEAELCQTLLFNPSNQSLVAAFLDHRAQAVKDAEAKASDKSQNLVAIARVFQLFSPESAELIFKEALTIAEKVDLEVIDVLHAICKMSERPRADTTANRVLAGRVSRLVRVAGDLLQSEDGFPTEETLNALAVMNLPVAAMTVARWSDEGFTDVGTALRSFLEPVLTKGTLDPVQAAIIDRISDDTPSSLQPKILEMISVLSSQEASSLLSELAEITKLSCGPQLIVRNISDFTKAIEILGGPPEDFKKLRDVFAFQERLGLVKQDNDKTDRYSPRSEQASENWNAVDPLNHEDMSDAEDADRQASIYGLDAGLANLRSRVGFADRTAHLSALGNFAREKDYPDAVLKAIVGAIDDWNGVAVENWRKQQLPKLLIELGASTLGYNWYHRGHFERLLELSGLESIGTRKTITALIETNASDLGSFGLLTLLAEFVRNLPIEEANRVLTSILERTEKRLGADEDELSRFVFSPDDLATTADDISGALLYHFMGDIDARIRWRASHALRRAIRQRNSQTLETVLDCAVSSGLDSYTFGDCPFQYVNADLHLAIVLARVAFDAPEIIQELEAKITALWEKCQPHILIGQFIARALSQALDAGCQLSITPTQIGEMNGQNAERKPKADDRLVSLGRHITHGKRFNFDSIDAIPYWYDPAARVFAELHPSVVVRTAEDCIVDRWGGHKESGYWKNEPRKRRFSDEDFGLHSASHGANPTVLRNSLYLQWHGVFMAVGELLKSNPLAAENGDSFGEFGNWVSCEETTYPDTWLSDLRGSIPLQNRYWVSLDKKKQDWVAETGDLDPIDEFFTEGDHVVLEGYRDAQKYEYGKQAASETIRSKSAFAPSKTSQALLHAYRSMSEYYDIYIPDSKDIDDEEKTPKAFRMLPTTYSPLAFQGLGIDEQDKYRMGARGLRVAPSAELLTALGLDMTSESWAEGWRKNSLASRDVQFATWSTMPDDSVREMRHRAYSFVDGYRLTIEKTRLQKVMRDLDCELIMTINFQRSLGENYDDAENKGPEEKRVEVILFRSDGSTETASGRVGTW